MPRCRAIFMPRALSHDHLRRRTPLGRLVARYWRNEIVDNFGPSNVQNVVKHSATLNRLMHNFLESRTPAVLAFLYPHREIEHLAVDHAAGFDELTDMAPVHADIMNGTIA
jgi:hypothetical protein